MYVYTYTHLKKWPEIPVFFVVLNLQWLFIFKSKSTFLRLCRLKKKTNSNGRRCPQNVIISGVYCRKKLRNFPFLIPKSYYLSCKRSSYIYEYINYNVYIRTYCVCIHVWIYVHKKRRRQHMLKDLFFS